MIYGQNTDAVGLPGQRKPGRRALYSSIAATRPTCPSSNTTLMPRGWRLLFVWMRVTVPSGCLPAGGSAFSTIFTREPSEYSLCSYRPGDPAHPSRQATLLARPLDVSGDIVGQRARLLQLPKLHQHGVRHLGKCARIAQRFHELLHIFVD